MSLIAEPRRVPGVVGVVYSGTAPVIIYGGSRVRPTPRRRIAPNPLRYICTRLLIRGVGVGGQGVSLFLTREMALVSCPRS